MATTSTPTVPISYQPSTLTHEQKKVAYIYGPHTPEDLERASRMGNFPTKPSNLFLTVYSDVMRAVEADPECDIVAPTLIASSGIVPLTINSTFDSLFSHYHDCIVNAQHEVMLASGFWKPGKATDMINKAFRELNRRIAERGGQKVLIKIMWARGAKGGVHYHRKNTLKQKVKATLPSAQECPFLDFETMDMHKMVLGVFHVKYMIVDRKILLITSANIQGKPNVELVVHLEGQIVDSLYNVFHKQWMLNFVPPLPLENVPAPSKSGFRFDTEAVHGPCIFHSEHAPVPMFLANRMPTAGFGRGKWENPQNVAWLSLMHNAQQSIVIQTPDFNAALPITGVLNACKRGVQVTIVLSWVYNALKEKVFQGGTNVHVMKKMYKKLMKAGRHQNLTVMFYVARNQIHPTKVHPNHTKFMSVDGEIAVFGSGNMDTQTWHHSQEVNIAVNSPLLVKEWTDLFKISQNTHLYGIINPNLPESPLLQIELLLAKNNTQPSHVTAETTSPPVINNSQTPVKTDSAFSSNQPYNNSFNTPSEIQNGSLQAPNNSTPINTANNITNQTNHQNVPNQVYQQNIQPNQVGKT